MDDDSDEEAAAAKEAKRAKPSKSVQYMRPEEIEGQEEATGAEFDSDGTRIEPFNMNEELEEGCAPRPRGGARCALNPGGAPGRQRL